jgi:predicted enzyme related to lactoylglutathione lyase
MTAQGDRPDPAVFGRGLGPGLGVNLLVADVAAAAAFQATVFGARIVWREADFAILSACGATWMLHGDRAYRDHPLGRAVVGETVRGVGVELRLYGADPDEAARRAEAAGGVVLCPPLDKPHGLREAYIIDPEGYVWAPSVPVKASSAAQ